MSDNKPNNRWIQGVITRAPEEKVVVVKGEEQKIAQLSIAVKSSSGEYYLGVTAWGEAADVALLIKKTGTPISVFGEPRAEQYNGKSYWKLNARHVEVPSNILFAALKQGIAKHDTPSQHQQQKQDGYMPQPDFAPMEQDEIPF